MHIDHPPLDSIVAAGGVLSQDVRPPRCRYVRLVWLRGDAVTPNDAERKEREAHCDRRRDDRESSACPCVDGIRAASRDSGGTADQLSRIRFAFSHSAARASLM
jgi:hypothetical protein